MAQFNTTGSLLNQPQKSILDQGITSAPKSGVLSGYSIGQGQVRDIVHPNITTPGAITGQAPTTTPNYVPGTTLVSGILNQDKTKNKDIKSIKPDGTVDLYSDQKTGTDTKTTPPNLNAPAVTSAPGTVGNNGSDFNQNLTNIQNASTGDTAGQGAANASAMYGMLGNERQLQPFAGGTTQGLDQSYANLTRPQSTGNLAGETGLFDVQKGILQNAANTSAQQAIANKQIATQGAESVAGLTAPQPYGITTTPYSPATNTFGTMPGGTTGAGNAGITLGNMALAQSIPTFQTAINQIDAPNTGIKDTIKNYLTSNPLLNPTPSTLANKITQWVQSGQLGDPKYQTLANYLTEFATTIAPILGAGGSVTNYKNQLSQNMVNGLAQGKSIAEVLDNESQLAQGKLAELKSTVNSGGSTNASSSNPYEDMVQ